MWIWYPRVDEPGGRIEPPSFNTRREFLDSLSRASTGAASGCRIAIRSSRRISCGSRSIDFDVLVTHEAPSCHRHGFAAIDRLAEAAAARLTRQATTTSATSSLPRVSGPSAIAMQKLSAAPMVPTSIGIA